jgi:hypothetical protein
MNSGVLVFFVKTLVTHDNFTHHIVIKRHFDNFKPRVSEANQGKLLKI